MFLTFRNDFSQLLEIYKERVERKVVFNCYRDILSPIKTNYGMEICHLYTCSSHGDNTIDLGEVSTPEISLNIGEDAVKRIVVV